MKQIDKDIFIQVCNEAKSMSDAAIKLGLHFTTFKRYALLFNCYKPNQAGKGIYKKPHNKVPLSEILKGNYPQYQTYKLKARLLNNHIKEYKCECCGLTMWNNKPIPLELHHIDGNRSNHILSNLMILCPNCHAQTDSYKAKNIK